MPQYDSVHFDPPAPVVLVTIRNPLNGSAISDVPMLLDTGADVSLLPQSSVEELGIQIDSEESYQLAAFDGERSKSAAVSAHVHFMSKTFRGKFVLGRDPIGVIGRDILNCLSLTFDGREQFWELDKP